MGPLAGVRVVEIAGIGPSRKRALLLAFGSAKGVSRAALSDLEKTPGINKATARMISAATSARPSAAGRAAIAAA